MAADDWDDLAILRRCRTCGQLRPLTKFKDYHRSRDWGRGRVECWRCHQRQKRGLPPTADHFNPSGANRLTITLTPLGKADVARWRAQLAGRVA